MAVLLFQRWARSLLRSQGTEEGQHQRLEVYQDHRDDRPRHYDAHHQVTVDGNTMVHVQKGDTARGEKDTKIVR